MTRFHVWITIRSALHEPIWMSNHFLCRSLNHLAYWHSTNTNPDWVQVFCYHVQIAWSDPHCCNWKTYSPINSHVHLITHSNTHIHPPHLQTRARMHVYIHVHCIHNHTHVLNYTHLHSHTHTPLNANTHSTHHTHAIIIQTSMHAQPTQMKYT